MNQSLIEDIMLLIQYQKEGRSDGALLAQRVRILESIVFYLLKHQRAVLSQEQRQSSKNDREIAVMLDAITSVVHAVG